MFGKKVKIEDDLYGKVEQAAERAGYSSTQEFITHTLEIAASQITEAESEEEVKKRLQGLGYLD